MDKAAQAVVIVIGDYIKVRVRCDRRVSILGSPAAFDLKAYNQLDNNQMINHPVTAAKLQGLKDNQASA